MGDRLTDSPGGRGLKAIAWTLLFALSIYAADRLILGLRPPEGWVEEGSTADVPAAAGPVVLPAILPNTLILPPARVVSRVGEDPGWWLGMRGIGRAGVVLWIGTGVAPPPEVLGNKAYCLDVATQSQCPEGWFSLSTSHRGRVLYVLSRLDRETTREILFGLQLAADEP